VSRPTLGRGLAALIPADILDAGAPAEGGRGALRMVPLDQVQPNPEQPRTVFSGPALEELAESIRAHGVLTPLLVRRNLEGRGYILIAGERRLRASGLAGLEEVPVWVRDDVGDREQLELALVENIQREDLDPIECALSYKRLCEDFGMTQDAVARRVGKDRATVANSIRLLKLPDFALVELRSGRISAGHAKALLSLADDGSIRRALKDVLTRELSVRATEALCRQLALPQKAKAKATKPALPDVTERLVRALGTRVRVEPRARGDRGRIVIDWFSREELDRIVHAIGR
jgi:ParB family transcriptional regulator, chromosome partitioning protein